MTFEYIPVADAIKRPGLRMVVVNKVPSPWGEAAKGIFHVKHIDWAAVHLVYDDPALAAWAGQLTGPVAVYNNEAPRAGWEEILILAEEADFPGFSEEWARWFTADPPARQGAKLPIRPKGIRISIAVTAEA